MSIHHQGRAGMPRVVLAMSGGVDSSVSAVLLQRQGYEVIGLFMRTGVHQPEPECDTTKPNKKGCCSAVDAGDARRVADRLDIPFYALNFEQEFNRIIDYFTAEYLDGRTPNPCVVCNNWLKFGKLWDFAQQLDADFIATGHYAQAVRDASGNVELHQGVDADKDQSYVLHGIKRDVLPHLMFPIGGYRKPEIRALAREMGLNVADKPDSVEICFVPNNDHASLIRKRHPDLDTAGDIVGPDGEVLGTHDGYERFTIGQRRGLGISGSDRRYVLEIVPATHTVVLGEQEQLYSTQVIASRINWLIEPPINGRECYAKIRYKHPPAPAVVHATPDGGATIRFETGQRSATAGQAIVFYEGSRVLGGGWIESAQR